MKAATRFTAEPSHLLFVEFLVTYYGLDGLEVESRTTFDAGCEAFRLSKKCPRTSQLVISLLIVDAYYGRGAPSIL